MPQSAATNDDAEAVFDTIIKVELYLATHGTEERLHDLRAVTPLEDHIADLHAGFGGAAALGVAAEDTALWIPMHSRYLTSEEWAKGIAQQRFWVLEGSTLQLRLSPERRAVDVVLRLELPHGRAAKAAEEAEADAKAAAYELRTNHLFERQFGEAFVGAGGISALLKLVRLFGKPTLQAYALQALRVALILPYALDALLRADGATLLVRLTHGADLRGVGLALEVLGVVSSSEHGFRIVHGATVRVAAELDEPSHAQLVSLIEECDDLEIKAHAFALINQLIRSAPDGASRARLLTLLTATLGLPAVLSSQLHVRHAAFTQQLRIFAFLSESTVPGSWAEAHWQLRRCQRMSRRLEELHAELEPHLGEHTMERVMLEELRRIRAAAAQARDDGLLDEALATADDEDVGEVVVALTKLAKAHDTDCRCLRVHETDAEAAAAAAAVVGDDAASAAAAARESRWREAMATVEELQTELALLMESERAAQETLEQLQISLDASALAAKRPAVASRGTARTKAASVAAVNAVAAAGTAAATAVEVAGMVAAEAAAGGSSGGVAVGYGSIGVSPPPLAPPPIGLARPPIAPPPLPSALALPPMITPGAMAPPAIGGGGPPPPPPPPPMAPGDAPRPPGAPPLPGGGGLRGKQPTKAPVAPAVKMKALHWKRILLDRPTPSDGSDGATATPAPRSQPLLPPPGPPTIWSVVDDFEFDRGAFEASFAAATASAARKDASAAKPAKPAVAKALDSKRSNAVAIMMSSLPPVNDVKAAIGSLDEKVLSREQLEKVRAHLIASDCFLLCLIGSDWF